MYGKGYVMKVITQSALRQDLYREMARVVEDADPTLVVRSNGENLVIITESELDSLRETIYLLSDPANAAALVRGVRQLEAGEGRGYDMSEFGL